jgi:5,10-methylenetetrahydrofolate reductase
MEKITDKLAALPKNGKFFSLEFFPPKTAMVISPSSSLPLSLSKRRGKVFFSFSLSFY